MSNHALKAAWLTNITPPTRKLVLVFMADMYNGITGQLNPSVNTVAQACGISPDQARRHLHALIDAGVLILLGNGSGGYHEEASRRYALNLATPTPCADVTPCMDATPCTNAVDPLHGCSSPLAPMQETPGTHASQTGKNQKEQEVNRKKTRERASVQQPDGVIDSVWTDFLAIRKAKRSPLTETALRLLMTEASKAGLSLNAALEMCCARGWQSFQADWVAGQQQSAADKFNPTAYVNDPQYRSAWDAKRNGYAGAAAVIFDDADHV